MPELQNILEQYGKQYKEKLDFCKEIEDLKIVEEFDKFISSLYAKDWIVYCKPPFKNAKLEILKKVSGKDFNLCPICGIGHLIRPSPA